MPVTLPVVSGIKGPTRGGNPWARSKAASNNFMGSMALRVGIRQKRILKSDEEKSQIKNHEISNPKLRFHDFDLAFSFVRFQNSSKPESHHSSLTLIRRGPTPPFR